MENCKRVFNDYVKFLKTSGFVFLDKSGKQVPLSRFWDQEIVSEFLEIFVYPKVPKHQKLYNLTFISALFFESKFVLENQIWPRGPKNINAETLRYFKITQADWDSL